MESAADAFGKGDQCGVGSWLKLAGGQSAWFSHRYTVSDFTSLGLPMQSNANLDISSYETLAQCFVLICFWKLSGSGRLAVSLPALSDNTGAESVCNRLYTSKVPLNLFVKKLSMWSSMTGIQLECSHISGEKNDDADLLSRWDGQSELPDRFLPKSRVHISLSDFWDIRFAVTLHPEDAFSEVAAPGATPIGPLQPGIQSAPLTFYRFQEACAQPHFLFSGFLGEVSACQFPTRAFANDCTAACFPTRFDWRSNGSYDFEAAVVSPASRNKRS